MPAKVFRRVSQYSGDAEQSVQSIRGYGEGVLPLLYRQLRREKRNFTTSKPQIHASRVRWRSTWIHPVEFVRVDLAKGENRRPEFLAINPNGKVPALSDGDVKL